MKAVDVKATQIGDLSADFVQKKFTPLLKKPMVSTGSVLAKDSVMLWETRTPEPTSMHIDEKQIEIYYPKQNTLEVYPISGQIAGLFASPVPRLAPLLTHFSFAAASAEEVEKAGQPDMLALRMTPTDAALREHVDKVFVLLDTKHGVIVDLIVLDADGDRTEIHFSNVKTNANLDASRLHLKLPADVKTVHPLEGLGPPPQAKPRTSHP
jgi:outer membrane lipoprotein-sorting protein